MPQTDAAPNPVMISLVLRLSDNGVARQAVYAALAQRVDVEIGELKGCWLPVVAETNQPMELHAWLESLPGVMFVDVTFVEVVADESVQPCSGDFSTEPLKK